MLDTDFVVKQLLDHSLTEVDLTHKAPPIICSRRQFQILLFYLFFFLTKNNACYFMRIVSDDSHEISYLIFSKIGKDVEKLSSAAIMIGALRVKLNVMCVHFKFTNKVCGRRLKCMDYCSHMIYKVLMPRVSITGCVAQLVSCLIQGPQVRSQPSSILLWRLVMK